MKSKISSQLIEKFCAKTDLRLTMKGSLKTLPPNIHWHFKKGAQKGVLEITLLKENGKLIFFVHKNRKGGWERQATIELKVLINKTK